MVDKPRLTSVGPGEKPPTAKRSLSKISFPYSDLAETEAAARRVAGSGGQCRPEQLSAWLGHVKLDSGAFRNKVAAAKLYGVLEGGRNGLALTGIGRRLVDEAHARQARVEAFLSVPLYLKIYEAHRGKAMPGVMALELEMLRHGVSRTQVKAARQVFLRSAEQAGFLEAGPGHLVLPSGTVFPVAASPGQTPGGAYPKVVEAILEQAPWGQEWTEQAFDEWSRLLIQASRLHFKMPTGEPAGP